MKSKEIPIHNGMHIVAELRERFGTPTDVYIAVRDNRGRDQIAFVEVGPDLVVVRAMRDALAHLLGDAPAGDGMGER